MNIISCAWCKNGKHFKRKYDFGDRKIFKCLNCNLLFTYPFEEADLIKNIYNSDYFRNGNILTGESVYGYSNYINERFYRQINFDKTIKIIKNYISKVNSTFFTTNPSLLDIGCGLGYFLDAAEDQGFLPEGLEVNEYASDYIKNKFQFQVHVSKSINYFPSSKKFDIITMSDVIEHYVNPFTELNNISKYIKKDGFLFIVTPDAGGIVSKILGKRLEDFKRIYEHSFFFTRKTLIRAVESNNFSLVSSWSLGHTFEIGDLILRNGVLPKRVTLFIYRIFNFLKIDRFWIYFNPHTKRAYLFQKK